jgi:hypothetical protein
MTTVTTRADPARMRQVAAQLEADNPRWIVIFGIYTREFIAFPRFAAPMGTVLSALYPEALPVRMRAAEARAGLAAAGNAPGEAATITVRLAG